MKHYTLSRLLPGITGAFGQHIVELSVRLGVDFVKYKTRNIQSMLGSCFSRKHLVKPGIAVVNDPLSCRAYLGTAQERGTHFHHLPGYIKDDRRLVAVTGSAIDFRARFVVGVEKVQGNSRSQLTLPVLLWYLYIGRQELPFPVFLDDAEQITHNLFLPGQ